MLSEKHSKGAFQISRSLFDSKIWTMPPEYLKAWVWIIGKCNHQRRERHGQVFERGECLITLDELRKELSYKIGYRTKSATKWQAWSICEWLRKEDMVTTRKTTMGIFIKVHKYAEYQMLSNYEKNSEGTSPRTINEQSSDNINNNEKNEIIERIEEHPETSLLLKRIRENCKKYKLVNEVSSVVLNKLVAEYGGKIRLGKEVEKYCNWAIENNVKAVTAVRLGNWFQREWDAMKKEERKVKDLYQDAGGSRGFGFSKVGDLLQHNAEGIE